MIRTIVHADSTTKDVHLGGWKKDVPDARDFLLKSLPAMPGAKLSRPAAVDNSNKCTGIEDQGQLGSCTANMFAGIVEYNDVRWLPKANRNRASRLFQYYATRLIEGTVDQDSGASIRDAIKAGATYGVGREADWWYNISKFTVKPPQSIWDTASRHKINSYHRIADGDLETMKQTLASGYLIGFGFEVHSNFMTQDMATNGVLHRPDPNDKVEGGHAVVLVGYDDVRGAFKVRNSCGKGWGIKGYFFMDYDYVADTNLCNDFWVVNTAPTI